jgi:hypothetical protein
MPSSWAKEKIKEIKKSNPKYSDEKARATMASIWWGLSDAKRKSIQKREEGGGKKKKKSFTHLSSAKRQELLKKLRATDPKQIEEEEKAEKEKHEQFEKGKGKPKEELKDVKDEELDDALKGLGSKRFTPRISAAKKKKFLEKMKKLKNLKKDKKDKGKKKKKGQHDPETLSVVKLPSGEWAIWDNYLKQPVDKEYLVYKSEEFANKVLRDMIKQEKEWRRRREIREDDELGEREGELGYRRRHSLRSAILLLLK